MRHILKISLGLGTAALAFTSFGNASGQVMSSDGSLAPAQGGAFAKPALSRELFKGCDADSTSGGFGSSGSSNSRDRIGNARGGSSGRVFAPVDGAPEASDPQSASAENCWSRLDGLWVERRAGPVFDAEFEADGWGDGANTPELRALTHGVYERPSYLIVSKTGRENTQLTVKPAFLGSAATQFVASDTRDLEQVLAQGGRAKQYVTRNARTANGRALTVRVIGGNSVVLGLNGRQYVRPTPELSAEARAAQQPINDAFNRDAMIQFLDVVAKGFDVTTQNPNRFADNGKDFIFAQPGPRDYYTQDRKIVPIDMALDLRSDQGAVYFSSLMSSAREIQSAYASNFGISTKIGVSGSKSRSNRSGTRSSSTNVETSIGFGASFSNSQFSQMRRSSSVSQAVGFSRQKQFALVRDYAQSELDPFFRDTIVSAVQMGRFDQVISAYGTHYPHATTYGASGQVRHTTNASGFQNMFSNASSQSYEGGGKFLIAEVNASGGSSRQNTSSFETSTEYGRAFFDAVGGNGSWNEGGFSAGPTAYPILMDMRPLDELLNPINFPGQPEIYEGGKQAFARAIDAYLVRAGRRLDRTSLRPEIIRKQRWSIRALSLACHGSGSLEDSDRIQLQGSIVLKVYHPSASTRTVFSAGTGKTYRGMFCDGRRYTATNATKYYWEGTADELSRAYYMLRSDFAEADFGSPIKALRVKQQGGLAQAVRPDNIYTGNSPRFYLPKQHELNASGRYVRTYGVPGGAAGKQPDLRLRIEFQRIE